MKYWEIPKDTIEEIIAHYNAGEKAKWIIAKYGISSGMLYTILKNNGVEQRVKSSPRTRNTTKGKKRTCPNCHKLIPAESRFCMFCGEDVRSEKDLLIERLTKLYSIVGFCPVNTRDEAQRYINEAIEYIKKK